MTLNQTSFIQLADGTYTIRVGATRYLTTVVTPAGTQWALTGNPTLVTRWPSLSGAAEAREAARAAGYHHSAEALLRAASAPQARAFPASALRAFNNRHED